MTTYEIDPDETVTSGVGSIQSEVSIQYHVDSNIVGSSDISSEVEIGFDDKEIVSGRGLVNSQVELKNNVEGTVIGSAQIESEVAIGYNLQGSVLGSGEVGIVNAVDGNVIGSGIPSSEVQIGYSIQGEILAVGYPHGLETWDINGSVSARSSISSIVTKKTSFLGSVSAKATPSSTVLWRRRIQIYLEPTFGNIGDLISIKSPAGHAGFNSQSLLNTVYFGNVIAQEVFYVAEDEIHVVVPEGAVSDNVHVDTPNSFSNEAFFEVIYPDEVYVQPAKKPKNKFNAGPSKIAVYNRDLSISNFVEIVDENSLIQNVYNILLTRPGERIFNSEFGCHIHEKVFDLMDNQAVIEKEILNMVNDSLVQFEPRATLVREQSMVEFVESKNAMMAILAIKVPTGSIKEIAITIGSVKPV